MLHHFPSNSMLQQHCFFGLPALALVHHLHTIRPPVITVRNTELEAPQAWFCAPCRGECLGMSGCPVSPGGFLMASCRSGGTISSQRGVGGRSGGGREENSERDRDGEETQFRWKKKTNLTQPSEGRSSRSCLRAALMRRCPWHMWQPLTASDWGFIKTVAVFLPRYRVKRRLTGTGMEKNPTWGCTRLNPLFGFHLFTEILSNLE